MKNTLFNFNIPQDFEFIRDNKIGIRLENTKEKHEHQSAYIDINLFYSKAIAGLNGNSFLDKYIAWSEGFKTEVVSSKKTTFKNYTAYRVDTKTDAVFQDKHFKINYLNLCILLDDTWCVEFQFVYETTEKFKYKNIAENTLQSLEILGAADTWLQAYLAVVKQNEEEYKASLRAKEVEEKLELKIAPFQIPKDGKEFIKIGKFNFDFIEEGCKWNTVEFSKKFYVQIKAKVAEVEEATSAGLLDEFGGYELENSEIQLSFDCTDIYQNGIPTGEFTFEESKTGTPYFIHFRANGIRLDFYGKITLQNGWLGINGVLKKSYQDKPCFTITVYKKLPTKKLDWTKYHFVKQEFEQVTTEKVHHLHYNNSEILELPQRILQCKNLKSFSLTGGKTEWISNKYVSTYAPLKTLPKEIGELTQLEELTINNFEITQLPESIGNLKQLKRFSMHACKVSQLPTSLFQLPHLESISISSSSLKELPETINLPKLKWIFLKKNQLTTLPEKLALQPNLKSLDLEENPWQLLPDAFNTIEEITLSIEDKKRLLNYDYQGADGTGTIQWNNETYLAKNDPNLQKKLLDAVKNTVLEKYQNPLEKLALKAVCIKTVEADSYKKIGNTRFGGLPDLPKGENYPSYFSDYEKKTCHYIFIAQLNCEDLAAYQDYFRRKGILYFYLQDEESFNCKVIYHPDVNDLQSAKNLEASSLNIFDMDEPYEPFKTEFSSFVALPSFYSDNYWYKLVEAPELENIEDYDHKDYKELNETARDNFRKASGKIGRYQEWNNCYYPDSHHSINDYVFTQHESPQEQAALKFKGNPEDWVVLLKVHSDNNCGFCFWDAGELFFVIHKSDLAKGDFSKVYASIESS